MSTRFFSPILLLILILAVGCSRQDAPTGLVAGQTGADKNGTETLGAPDITLAAGTGFIQAGTGMEGVASGSLQFTIPADATVAQVLLYWAGGTTDGSGDDAIVVDGHTVQGDLIGGPVFFYAHAGGDYDFSAYRADITGLGLVQAGANDLTVSGFDFDDNVGAVDENNGCSIVVILDGGGEADFGLVDGLDMAYFGFQPTLDATVPQTFTITPADEPRVADLLILAASVGEDRPNRVRVTTSAGDQVFDDALGSNAGMSWDSIILPVDVPAGAESVTVELISIDSDQPQGASLGWVAAGLALAAPVQPAVEITGSVFVDVDEDQLFGELEAGVGNVVIDVTDAQGQTESVVTDENGAFVFSGLPGTYTVTVDPASHGDFFNADLQAIFTASTALTFEVEAPSVAVDFGFRPDVDTIVEDLDSGDLGNSGRSLRWWRKVFARGVLEERAHRRAYGHERCHHGGHRGRGWGHHGSYPDAERLHEILATVQGLYQDEPYRFDPERELRQVLRILLQRPRTDQDDLFRELLVTELNYAGGYGFDSENDRLGVLIAWGESVYVLVPADEGKASGADKSIAGDLLGALRVFRAINTGGGGGVDE